MIILAYRRINFICAHEFVGFDHRGYGGIELLFPEETEEQPISFQMILQVWQNTHHLLS